MKYSFIQTIIPTLIVSSSVLIANERLQLKNASLLENKTTAGESIKYISGNVIFLKGDLTLNCDEGRHYDEKGLAILYQNVSAIQKGRSLTCDTIKFFSNEDKLISIGNSRVWEQDYDLKADSITVFTKIDSGVALGNVTLFQKGQVIKADRIEYQKGKTHDGVSYTAIGGVTITDSTRIATCERAQYKIEKEITTLEIEPKIKDGGRILSGEKIELTYQNELLKKLFIPRKALAITPIDGYQRSLSDSLKVGDTLKFDDRMEGSELISFFKNGVIDSLRIGGMAKTLYHVFEDSIYQGKNNASGDTIIMIFKNNELDILDILGGSKGKYLPDPIANDMSTPIVYSADKIQYRLIDEESDFKGNANIKHDKTDLEAGFINIDWKTNLLKAFPGLRSDTTSLQTMPLIREEGKDPMVGDSMVYSLKSKKGKISMGKTKADDGYYTGNKIRNQSNKVFFIENSTYTTCDLDTAHFHFESKKMKIIQNDLVIAKPIILHLGQIPILGIPLGIFPHKGGQRHSGWIMPSYGDNKNRGQYIQGLGFYWAPSDYWDSKFTMGFGDKQGATFRLNTVYRLRYKFSGNLSFFNQQYLNGTSDITKLSEQKNTSTTLKWVHKQDMRNNQSLNANITYSTNGDYNKKYGLSQAERMDQKAISNLSYSKRWPKAKNSFSSNYYSNIDLLVSEKTNPISNFYVQPSKAGTQINIGNKTFPKFSFRHGQTNFFPTSANKKKWYNTISWDYGLNYTNKDRDYYESEKIDSVFVWTRDSSGALMKMNEKNNAWVHTTRLNAPQKLFKYISINPSINLKSVWVNETQDGIWDADSGIFKKSQKQGFASRTTGSFAMNANTQIFGLFPIPFGPVKAIRHVMSPSIGYSWTPDFSKPLFGYDLDYVFTETDSIGNEVFHDRFVGSMAGNTPRSEQKTMTLGLNNIFQAKIKQSDNNEKKIDLMSWRMNSGYNFAADSMRLSNLRSSARSKIAGKLNLDLSMTHDFYKYDKELNRRIKKFNKNEDGIIAPRLTNVRLSTGFKISGKNWNYSPTESSINEDTLTIDDNLNDQSLNKSTDNPLIRNNNKKLWSTNISLSYNYSVINPDSPTKNFWANTTSNLNVTKKWKVSYRARFDLIKRDLINHSFSIYRDLHCWELSLGWTPSGLGQGINFKLNVKSPTLQDLKIEKRGGIYSGAGF